MLTQSLLAQLICRVVVMLALKLAVLLLPMVLLSIWPMVLLRMQRMLMMQPKLISVIHQLLVAQRTMCFKRWKCQLVIWKMKQHTKLQKTMPHQKDRQQTNEKLLVRKALQKTLVLLSLLQRQPITLNRREPTVI